jgi:hypothetical protein
MFSKEKKTQLGTNVRACVFNARLLARSRFASGRPCDQPTRSKFSIVFLGPRANAQLVPIYLLKLQCLQNKVLRTIGSFPRGTSVRNMHMAFQIPYVYDYITKSCRQQAEVVQNHENENVRYTGQGEARHKKYK